MKHWKQSGMPDEELTGELSAYAPGDTDTMERIFKRSEAKYQQMQESFAEEETYQVEHEPPRVLLRAMAGLAACAVIGVGGFGLWKLSRHTPPVSIMSPGERVDAVWKFPFAEDMERKTVTFMRCPDAPFAEGEKTLPDAELTAFRQALDTLSWTETMLYDADNEHPVNITGEYFTMYLGNGTPDGSAVIFLRDEQRVLWSGFDGSPVHEYALTESQYDALFAIVSGGEMQTTPETISITLTAKDVTPDGLTLVLDTTEPIPADTILYGKEFSLWALQDDEWVRVPQFNETAVFTSEGYPFTRRTELAIDWNWIYGTLSQGHYRIGKRFTDSRRTGDNTDYELYAEFDITPEMAGTPVSELPFSIKKFRNDLMFMMVPAYAPNLFSVTGLQERLADAMERSVWIETEPTLRDGESASLYVCGGEKGEHYALEFDHLGYVYVHFGDGETIADCTPTKCYRVSAELTLAAQQLASKPTTEAKNGLDPTKGMFHYEPQGGNAVNEVWEQMDDMAQQADMSAYEEVIRDHNQRHGDSVSLLTREECEALGISYCNYLWQTTRMTPEEYGEYLEQTWQDTYNR